MSVIFINTIKMSFPDVITQGSKSLHVPHPF